MHLILAGIADDFDAPYVPEWKEHHLGIGFDEVVLLDAQDYPFPHQENAYNSLIEKHRNDVGTWIAFFDTDEFLVPAEGTDLRDLLGQHLLACTAALAVHSRVFGSSGLLEIPASVRASYTKCAPYDPKTAVKTIVQPKLVEGYRSHPHLPQCVPGYTAVDTSGLKVHVPHVPPNFSNLALHHYYTRSRQEWEAKVARWGRGKIGPRKDMTNADVDNVDSWCTETNTDALRFIKETK